MWSEAVGSSLLTKESLEYIMSPITVLRRELLPDPTDPMIHTNSPFLIDKSRLLRIKSSLTSARLAAADSSLASSSF